MLLPGTMCKGPQCRSRKKWITTNASQHSAGRNGEDDKELIIFAQESINIAFFALKPFAPVPLLFAPRYQ